MNSKIIYNEWAKKQLLDPTYMKICEWKGKNLATIIQRNGLNINSIAELRGGSGVVINVVRSSLNIEDADNYELTDFSINEGRKRFRSIQFIKKDLLKGDITKNYDLVILSDIIEHVEDDIGMIKKALEYSKYVALKILIEKYLFSKLFEIIGVKDKIGVNHSAGHLHEYSASSVWNLFKEIDMEIMDFFFDVMNPKDTEFVLDHKKQLNFVQKIYRIFKLLLFRYFSKMRYCKVFGGSLFVLVKQRGYLNE